MRCRQIWFGCIIVWAFAGAHSTDAAPIVVIGDVADMTIIKSGTRINAMTGRVGAETSPITLAQGSRVAVYVFQLPSPPPGMPIIDDASFQFTIVSDLPDGAYNIDLYGLGARTLNTVLSSDNFFGALDTSDATLIQDDIIPSVHPDLGVENVTTSAAANSTLVDYLNAQYTIGGPGNYVFLRLNPDTSPPNEDTGVNVAFADNDTGKPQLTINFVVPEPRVAAAGLTIAALCVARRRVREAPSVTERRK
jgi:hypothetical protein